MLDSNELEEVIKYVTETIRQFNRDDYDVLITVCPKKGLVMLTVNDSSEILH